MQDRSPHLTPTKNPKRLRPPRRRHRWAAISALAVGAGLSLAACGSSSSIATLDTGKIERAIAQSSLAQRGAHAEVSCPAAVPQVEGLEFSCMARVGPVSTRFLVVQRDGAGRVHFEAPSGR